MHVAGGLVAGVDVVNAAVRLSDLECASGRMTGGWGLLGQKMAVKRA